MSRDADSCECPADDISGVRPAVSGCQFIGNCGIKCGETQTLQIIKQFKALYEERLEKITEEGGSESDKARIRLQEDWIKDLTEQNEMLVRVVEELELEATERVAMLEEKLKASARNGLEVMKKYRDFDISLNLDETFQRLGHLQSDVNNLVEFIRRVREDRIWSSEGLQFYEVSCDELFGCGDCPPSSKLSQEALTEQIKVLSHQVQHEDKTIKDLQDQLTHFQEQKNMSEIMQQLRKSTDDYAALKKSMLDMRDALTAEVADKHDVILNLRRDLQQLEDQCRQVDKQTLFKDDIIKELRKEIKQLKQQKRLFEKQQSQVSQSSHNNPNQFYNIPQHPHNCCPFMLSNSINCGNIPSTIDKNPPKMNTIEHNDASQNLAQKLRDNQAVFYIQDDRPEQDFPIRDNVIVAKNNGSQDTVTPNNNHHKYKRKPILTQKSFPPEEYICAKSSERKSKKTQADQEYPSLVFTHQTTTQANDVAQIVGLISPRELEKYVGINQKSSFLSKKQYNAPNTKCIVEQGNIKLRKQRSKLTKVFDNISCENSCVTVRNEKKTQVDILSNVNSKSSCQSVDSEKEKQVNVPSHIPVKTFVYNLEINERELTNYNAAKRIHRMNCLEYKRN